MSEARSPANPRLPESARAVVVGAGIVGASVAYHLAREGWTDVVVIDQGPLWETGGSSSHAPGLVFQLNPSHTMTRLAGVTVDVLSALEVDGLPCYHPVGGIEVAATEERWAELDRRYGRARGYGLEAALLTPAEVRDRIPLIDPDRILGGLLVERDGIAKAVRGAEAMGRAAADSAGTLAVGSCEATGLLVEGGRVRGVETALGPIRADTVVLCAGIWGPKAGRLLGGVGIPLVPVQHQYAFTAPLPELAGETREVVHPILRHQDHSMYFRQHADAYGIGNYRHEPRLTEPDRSARPAASCSPRSSISRPRTSPRPRARGGRAAARAARRRAAPHVQRPHVVHARRLPAARRERCGPRPVAGRGDLGHALRRRGPRAGGADDRTATRRSTCTRPTPSATTTTA